MHRTVILLALGIALALAAATPSEAVRRRAFVTSVTGTGNLSSWPDAGGQTGLAAGDAICRARAAAASLPNANTFRAWLSTTSTDAYCHVQGRSGHRDPGCSGTPQPAGPWFRFTFPSSLPVSESLDELMAPAGIIYRPVLFDEFGAPADLPPSAYWTGTDDGGATEPDFHCSSWTSAAEAQLAIPGNVLATAQTWTYSGAFPCSGDLRLLCLEPGASEPTGQRWSAPGAIVFVTTAAGSGDLGSWPEADGATGLAAGDAICANVAAAAHLPAPESFVAWLSDATHDALDRLTSNGPFRRIDGVTVANTKADLVDGSIDNSIHQRETGAYQIHEGGGYAYTGTAADGTAAPERCLDWTSPGGADTGLAGHASDTASQNWTDYYYATCNAPLHLYCMSNVVTLFWDGFDYTGDASRWSGVVP